MEEKPEEYQKVFRINEMSGLIQFYGMIEVQKYSIQLNASNGMAAATEEIMILMEYYPPPLPPTNYPPMFVRPLDGIMIDLAFYSPITDLLVLTFDLPQIKDINEDAFKVEVLDSEKFFDLDLSTN